MSDLETGPSSSSDFLDELLGPDPSDDSKGDSFGTVVSGAEHPIMRHQAFVIFFVLLGFLSVFSISGVIMNAYAQGQQRTVQSNYDALNIDLVIPTTESGGGIVELSSACYVCSFNITYNINGDPVPTTKPVVRFKGQMSLDSSVRDNLHFPSGLALTSIITPVNGISDYRDRDSYVRFRTLGDFFMRTSPTTRISTWAQPGQTPKSSFALVPATYYVVPVGTPEICNSNTVGIGGSIYGKFNSTGTPAICTCITDTTTVTPTFPQGTPTELCSGLSLPGF